jgi:Tol biopolymer transport system component/DNA-binding winged helix-turn-helix (wHTH) protein
MADVKSELRLLRFGDFEADLRSGELRKAGRRLKFGGQPFQVLTILLEQPGEVVTREELQKRLWPDTFVDVDHNLNTAINKIREVLGDSAESPRFVETVPRRGYRFIGELEPPAEPVVEPVITVEPDAERDRGSGFRRLWWKVAAGVLMIAIITVVAAVIYRRSKPQGPQEQAALTPVPFTALPGWATSPAFSPDGSRIAFAWNGDPKGGDNGFDLYGKALGSETLLRLTQHPSEWISPAWSPDGTQIAFHRVAGADTGIYVVPALGGPERKLHPTEPPREDYPTVSWSPDGKWIAFSDWLPAEDHSGIYFLSPETGETERIPNTAKCLGQVQPVFSHRGEYLAYWCFRSQNEAVLYSLPLQGGEPKMVSMFRDEPTGLAWSADDKELIFTLFHGFSSSRFGKVTVADGSVKMFAFAASAELPTVSAGGDKLAFSSNSSSQNIWRRDLLHPESPPVELVPSSRWQCDAQYSPDGKRIAFASMRSGLQGVWISNEDGSNLVQISNPARPSGSPQWSPDGNKIVFDSLSRDGWEIYIADVAERVPRKLVTNITNVFRPYWSRDGKWIYLSSAEPGKMGVYRCPVSGGEAVVLSKDVDGISPRESFDGKTIYFASHDSGSTLRKVALSGLPGTESEVDGLPRLIGAGVWTLSQSGIYFVPADAPRSLRYFDFATKQIRTIFEGDKKFGSGLSVSPDGRWILYSLVGDVDGDIMIVDHFR